MSVIAAARSRLVAHVRQSKESVSFVHQLSIKVPISTRCRSLIILQHASLEYSSSALTSRQAVLSLLFIFCGRVVRVLNVCSCP